MNELKVFSSTEFGELGIMMIDGKEFFPATQCAKVLGYTNTKDAIIRHCKGVVKHDLPTNGGVQTVNYIPEGDLYRLIARSKLPAAEKFERWVFDEVLPSIRKNGGYGNETPNLEQLIARTATVVVAEVMKQLAPFLSTENAFPPHTERNIIEEIPRIKRKRRSTSVISKLDEELRAEIEDMIINEKCSYEEIKDYLARQGIKLSITSIWRYANYLYR